MVQMKVRLDKTTIRNKRFLYIPHGSDESGKQNQPDDFLDAFISHMVQMKGVKQLFFTPVVVLYIPHGSDESL